MSGFPGHWSGSPVWLPSGRLVSVTWAWSREPLTGHQAGACWAVWLGVEEHHLWALWEGTSQGHANGVAMVGLLHLRFPGPALSWGHAYKVAGGRGAQAGRIPKLVREHGTALVGWWDLCQACLDVGGGWGCHPHTWSLCVYLDSAPVHTADACGNVHRDTPFFPLSTSLVLGLQKPCSSPSFCLQ